MPITSQGRLIPSTLAGSIPNAASQGDLREQLAVLTDLFAQVAGGASVFAGSAGPSDPLSAPFKLYVNRYIGSDRFVGGAFNTFEEGLTDEEIIESKLKRIEMQRLECGYTPHRPFKTINRAVIEAAIITSKNWYTYSDPRAHLDCVSIELAPGVQIIYNGPGSASSSLTEWGTTHDPTPEELTAFNPVLGGVILPRGCSIWSPDLRRTVIRPSYVPTAADELADYSNRRAILKTTGAGFAFGFTFMDKVGHGSSHHLLDAFAFAPKTELDLFYQKINSALGEPADLATSLLVSRKTEYEIVGPIEQGVTPTQAWDTVDSASFYVFNCSIRSRFGIGGIFADGDKVTGLKSFVTAQFTGTSLQTDMSCWEVYKSGNWVQPVDYAEYISTPPDNVRMKPARVSRHIQAINDAFIQEVSVFAIGQGVHHYTDNGGEITVTNSNSSFGGCAAISKGYKRTAFPQDKNWTIGRITAPVSLSEKIGNVRLIYLGTVKSFDAGKIELDSPLAVSTESTTIPDILLREGYSLPVGNKIWVENLNGDDWRTDLASGAWSSSLPDTINVTGSITQAGTNAAPGVIPAGNPNAGQSFAIGKRVYIRRLVDTRTPAERRLSLQLNNTASARLPESNFVLQTDPSRVGGAISRVFEKTGSEVLTVGSAGRGKAPGVGVATTAEITVRRASPQVNYQSNTFYRAGAVVRHVNKHYMSLKNQTTTSANPSPDTWAESFVHMPSAYNPEDTGKNEAPILILDKDVDPNANTATCGINFTTDFLNAGSIRDQYRSGSDYLGVHALLVAMGYTASVAHEILVPRLSAERELDPSSAIDLPSEPSGGAASARGNWAIEFRRPSILRVFGHAWEWAGFLNYSKAIPGAQQTLGPQNKFSYYFTNQDGGRCVPQGSNEDGFNVSPRGLEDIQTGATLSVEQVGGATIDEFQSNDFPNGITAGNTSTFQDLVINGLVNYTSDQSKAKTTREGVVKLATIDQLVATGSNAPVASTDAGLETSPDAVTIQGLNRWAVAQRFVRTSTDTLTIFVDSSAPDRDLDSMLDTPPTEPGVAIPTMARAAEYANALIGSGNQTADIKIAPGLYDPASVWECSVRILAVDPTQEGWPLIFASNSAGSQVTDNNYFDGSGYGDLETRVNFVPFSVDLRSDTTALQLNVIGRQMLFRRTFEFVGGFHFLGISEIIKLVASGDHPAESFLTNSAPLAPGSYTTDTPINNVNTFLNAIRVANSRTPNYEAWTTTSPISAQGDKNSTGRIHDCVFGPILPSRKEAFGGTRAPYIDTRGDTALRISNVYLRGRTEISSAAIGVTNAVPNSNLGHYGTASVAAPWFWNQFHHTFLGSIATGAVRLERLGTRASYLSTLGSTVRFANGSGRLLPNHVVLLSNTGAVSTSANGPVLDQIIHAGSRFEAVTAFNNAGSTAEPASVSSQGFLGVFGNNGYNDTKTRGVLLGSFGTNLPEKSCSVFMAEATVQAGVTAAARTLFYRAGFSFDDRNLAAAPYQSRAAVNAGSFVIGREYQITTVGTTDFTLIGATSNTVGLVFVANGVGSGTGVAVPTAFGRPFNIGPSGRIYNVIFSSESNSVAGGPLGLNLGLNSYQEGISPEYAFSINSNCVL